MGHIRSRHRRAARGTWIRVEPGEFATPHSCDLPDIFEREAPGYEPRRLLFGVGSQWRCKECKEIWVVHGAQYSSDGSRPWFAHLVRESALSKSERDELVG